MKKLFKKGLRQNILYNHMLHLVLGVFFGLWLTFFVIQGSAQTTNVFFPFNTFIASHNNTTNISFKYWWNNLHGILAWSWWIKLETPENIYISWSSNSISCSKQLEWLYYNAIRWAALWPMDNNTLQKLKEIDGSYNNVVVEWWFYTDCVWENINNNFVIWKVTNSKLWLKYHLFAGLLYDDYANNFSETQRINAWTLVFQNNIFKGRVFDMYGGWIWDLSYETTPWTITIWWFTWAVFFPGISSVTNAEPKQLYSSNIFTVAWLTWNTLLSISSWALLVINGSWIWTTGLISNNTPIKIEMFASDQYDTTVNSLITVGWLQWTFSITTKPKQPARCLLTKEEKESIRTVFSGLLEEYWTTAKLTVLMNTMKSMINDMQDFNYDCNLEYLQSLVEEYLNQIWWWTGENTHIAPNCKKYSIIYNDDKKWYTSSNLKIKQYFATRQSLIKFIDSKNPWDCHITIYLDDNEDYNDLDENMYAAPNGKVYEIAETAWIYRSPTMLSKKDFPSRESIISFIDKNNPKINVWDHKVDTTRTPIIYAASNSKEYKIYKTDKGFMSYKLVKVYYYNTSEEIIAYIEKNNKR